MGGCGCGVNGVAGGGGGGREEPLFTYSLQMVLNDEICAALLGEFLRRDQFFLDQLLATKRVWGNLVK